MTVIWTVIAAVVIITALLVVLEVQNARHRRAVAHLEPTDPRVGERAEYEAAAAISAAQGLAGSAHPGASGAGSAYPH